MATDSGNITTDGPLEDASTDTPVLVEDELLVEEISIDGMCGVY
jgi:mycofactocin precursor